MKRVFKRIYLAVILLFLYAPIILLVIQSFNKGRSRAKWEGFSLDWYVKLFQDADIMRALWITLSIALLATVIATVLGTLAAIGIHAMRKKPQGAMMTLTNLPNTMPDIVTGISLMLLFITIKQALTGLAGFIPDDAPAFMLWVRQTLNSFERGYFTMLLAHITFDTPYVILSVLPKLRQMNKHTYEAALDLGAKPGYALTHVIIPECKQGIMTGALLAFTLSLDDFTISYFTTSPMVQNLSTLIFSSTKRGVSPEHYALSALMFVVLLALLLVLNIGTADKKD